MYDQPYCNTSTQNYYPTSQNAFNLNLQINGFQFGWFFYKKA